MRLIVAGVLLLPLSARKRVGGRRCGSRSVSAVTLGVTLKSTDPTRLSLSL
jgi:hypothetical protein